MAGRDEKTTAEDPGKHDMAHATAFTITPPRTPTAFTTSAHELFAEISDIYDTLSSVPNLAPGSPVNELLTRLVSLCIEPRSADFTKAFFSITGVAHVCEQLRPLCATAECELEQYWASRLIREAEQGMSTLSFPDHNLTQPNSTTPQIECPLILPVPPKLYRSLPPRMLHARSFPPCATAEDSVHRLRPPAADFAMYA